MKITFLLISLFIIVSILLFTYRCHPNKAQAFTNNQGVKFYIESFVDFLLFDNEGNNLLSPKYKYQDKIDILISNRKGEVTVYNDPTKMASKGYLVDENDYSIRLYLSEPEKDSNVSKTILRFDNKKDFVFITEFEVIDNSSNTETIRNNYQRKKIWVNGTLFWDRDSDNNTFPKLILIRD